MSAPASRRPASIADAARALANLHEQVAGWSETEAFNGFVNLAYVMKEAGHLGESLLVVDDAFHRFPGASLIEIAEGHNVRGQVLQQLGRLPDARVAHEAMARIGRELGDARIEGAAEFALGTVAQLWGDGKTARQHYATAFRLLRAVGDGRSLVQILLNLSQIRLESGQIDEAGELVASAGELLSKSRDVRLRASWNGTRGNWLAKKGEHEQAASAYRASLRDARRAGAGSLVLKACQNLGAVHMDLGKPKIARRWYEKGIEAAQAIGSAVQRIALYRGAALAAHHIGDGRAVAEYFETVRHLAIQGEDVVESARAAVDLASVALTAGDSERARVLLDEARPVLSADRDRTWFEVLWVNTLIVAEKSGRSSDAIGAALGTALEHLGMSETALKAKLFHVAAKMLTSLRAHERASEFFREAAALKAPQQNARERAWQLAQAGALLLASGGAAEAVEFFAKAARAYARLRDEQLVFYCRNDQANALAEVRRYRAATRLYAKCLELGERLGDRLMIAQASLNWGETLRRQHRPKEALARVQRAARAYERLGDVSGHANAQSTLGLVLKDLGEIASAELAFQKGVALARKSADDSSLAVSLGGLADLARDAGRLRRAVTLYRRTIAIERSQADLGHEAETQAGLIVALGAIGDAQGAQASAQRLLTLATTIGRAELASWAFGEAGNAALDRGHEDLGLDLFALLIVAPFMQSTDFKETGITVAREIAHVVVRLVAHDAPRLGELVGRLADIIERHLGSTVGSQLRRLLRKTEEIALSRKDARGTGR